MRINAPRILSNGNSIGTIKKILFVKSSLGNFKSTLNLLFLNHATTNKTKRKISKQIIIGINDKGLSVIPTKGRVQLTIKPANIINATLKPTT
ncbi:hypothetical protein ACFL0X_00825 [Nanoarchaeota archaeon]